MKKVIWSAISIMGLTFFIGGSVFAQNNDGHTAREEAEGKAVWEKLQAKELTCKDLSDDNFGTLGEYFMGQMMGNSHEAMNTMMERMMGKESEEQMHVAMGKRLSGCDTTAAFPVGGVGFMPMMQMMTLFRQGFGGQGGESWIFMVLWWVLVVAAVVVLIRWLTNQSKGGGSNKSALDILKERYARGEIDKKEFEDKKKDL